MKYYQAFGLCFAADLDLIEFTPHNVAPSHVDVTIVKGPVPEIAPQKMLGTSQGIILDINPVARFYIEAGKRIVYDCYPNIHIDELRLFLLGSCIGALLQQLGYIVLHGNSISMDGKHAVLFIGHSGAGKSTTAAWHLQQNHHVLSDDICAISIDKNQVTWVIPSYPQIKLWQNAADLLKINTAKLRRIRPQDDKFALIVHKQFYPKPLPLKKIIELQPNQLSQNKLLNGVEKLKCLITHSYRRYFLRPMALEVAYDKQLIQLANLVEIQQASRYQIESLI